MEMHGMARLAEIPTERAVTTLVPRDEIAGALADPAHSPELYLDVIRGEEEGTIGISWSHDELEQLLADATGDDVVLTFDRDELQTIFDDVEAHGLREKGLVFAVAAAGALGSGATIANAAPALDQASSGASVAAVQTLAAESLATDAGASSNVRTPGLQIGDEPATIATPSAKVATIHATNADTGNRLERAHPGAADRRHGSDGRHLAGPRRHRLVQRRGSGDHESRRDRRPDRRRCAARDRRSDVRRQPPHGHDAACLTYLSLLD